MPTPAASTAERPLRRYRRDFHLADFLRWRWSPEAAESDRREARREAAMIAGRVACGRCFAPVGTLCVGVTEGYHADRGATFARTGGAVA